MSYMKVNLLKDIKMEEGFKSTNNSFMKVVSNMV